MLQTVNLAHMPPELAVHVALYTKVENAPFLKDQLLAGNTDFEYAFINASMIISTKYLLAATFRATNDYLSERMKSRNVHSEIVFCLSPNNNIGEASRKFGVLDSTKDLVVIKVSTNIKVTHQSVESHLQEVIKGTLVPFGDSSFMDISDLPKIAKAYKLLSTPQSKGKPRWSSLTNGDSDTAQQGRQHLEVSVLGLMALRAAA